MTVNKGGKTVTVSQRPSGGRNPGSNQSITHLDTTKPTGSAPKIRTKVGQTVAGTGRKKT